MNTQVLYDYAMQLVGTPYKFGGNNPLTGIDCSGLVIELLVAVGKWKHGVDANAQTLFNHCRQGGKSQVPPQIGGLAFYGAATHDVGHIALCLDANLMVEAGGGTSTTISLEEAKSRNAFVRIRPIRYRGDFLGVWMP